MTQNYNGITVDWTENEWSRLQDVRNERVEKDERVRNAAIRGLKYILEEEKTSLVIIIAIFLVMLIFLNL